MDNKTKQYYNDILSGIEKDGLFKKERIITSPQSAHIEVMDTQQVLNMCANNYLGLADNPDIIQA
ncbi:MAG: glycine C-acetyltransferase, partial [Ignavibacteriaceae bacterium]|nr:glycine C-acetyltransferase [Ignavibacteriaceae bacterium]